MRQAPAELLEERHSAGLLQTTVFRRGTDAWWYVKSRSDTRSALAIRDGLPAHLAWQRGLRDVVAPAASASAGLLYVEVFHTDEGARLSGPMRRGLLSLVIDPEQAAAYDALHADAWPELIEALAASGFRDYSGFRSGAHVVYYGEYYPDMPTVFARMAEHEVDARWGVAMAGIITMIQDPDGWLITADEVAHWQIDEGRFDRSGV